jgi:acyl-CoA reductase-like NAD-dependent aldehyde dehydrogenase
MAEIVFMHHDKNGAREVMRHDTATITAEYKAMKAAQDFVKWAAENPDATQKEVLHRFIDLPELAQKRLGSAITEESKRRGLLS